MADLDDLGRLVPHVSVVPAATGERRSTRLSYTTLREKKKGNMERGHVVREGKCSECFMHLGLEKKKGNGM